MYDHSQKKYTPDRLHGKSAALKGPDRRRSQRHTFTAAAEVTELRSGTHFSARTTDFGPGGCFVDMLLPFSVGSEVHLKIRNGKSRFEMTGVVVYSQTGLGMGIAFSKLDSAQRVTLERWLEEVTNSRAEAASREVVPAVERLLGGSLLDQAALMRLIRLMVGKGILTVAEGSSVLADPII